MFKRFKLSSMPMLVGLIAFEFISYSSSKQGFMMLFGMEDWARLLAFSFVAVDFAGAGVLFFGGNELKESYWTMFAGWVLTVLGDVGLAYLNVATSMSQRVHGHILVQTGVISEGFFTKGIPLLIALLLTGIEVFLVHSLNMIIVEVTSGTGRKKINNQPKQNNKPKNVQTQRVNRQSKTEVFDWRKGIDG